MSKAKMGHVMNVVNTNPRPNASEKYMALWIEDEDGDNERCIMFRESDIKGMPIMSFPKSLKIDGKMKEGRLYHMSIGSSSFYALKMVVEDNEKIVRITSRKISVAEKLAKSNEEDIPDRGFLNDMMD